MCYQRIGLTHSDLGNLDKGLTFFEKDIELSKELYATYPNNVEFKNSLATSYANLGVFSRNKLKNKVKAKTYFQQAEKLWIELTRDAPHYVQFQRFLKKVQEDIARL